MKKKIIALAAMVLIVALVCSLAACNGSSMFDGSYRKEASEEQAKSAWTGARVAFGIDTETLATASESNEMVKGWTGLKFSYDYEMSTTGTYNGEKAESSMKMKSDGAILFEDGSTSVTGTSSTKTVRGKEKSEVSASVGVYVKDDVLYNDLTINNASIKIQFPETLGVVGSAIQSSVSQITYAFTGTAFSTVNYFLAGMTYDEFVQEYAGIKAYVNDSGNYVRVKYAFTPEVVEEMFDEFAGEDFVTGAKLNDCSLILVTDKETGTFQGAKLSFDFSFSTTIDGNAYSVTAKSVSSVENCSAIKSYPSDLSNYKNANDLNLSDVNKIISALLER